eukprot:Phypoly_transcript_09199.p1 GENE.Phypoly_transcript_09199~~Phypoly_transcript_09199.p1  ORF type:complete len:416 (+),score=61.75 Phypoly_transcript_09199:100-1347(+)
MAEPSAIKREIQSNARWALYEAEQAGVDGSKQLLMVFAEAEAQRVGLPNLREKFELFQKLHVALGSRVLFATHLLPHFDKVVIAFALKSKKKLALYSKIPSPPIFLTESVSPPVATDLQLSFHSLRTCSPIHFLKDYLAVAIFILRLFWDIHKQGMVHNGISMEGLLVRPGGLPKVQLVDLGDLREGQKKPVPASDGDQRNVGADFYKYSSPESTGRTSHVIDQRTDIYSLGALLYELATGAPPFISAQNDPLDLIHLHMTQAPPALPAHLWPNDHRTYAEQITTILHKMMGKAPHERYHSLYGVIRDFEFVSRAVQRKVPILSFAVAQYDLWDQFHIPDTKLYGRERELSRMAQFIDQFREARDTCVVLVGGASGVGKSSMVRKVLDTMNARYKQAAVSGRPPIMLTGMKYTYL